MLGVSTTPARCITCFANANYFRKFLIESDSAPETKMEIALQIKLPSPAL